MRLLNTVIVSAFLTMGLYAADGLPEDIQTKLTATLQRVAGFESITISADKKEEFTKDCATVIGQVVEMAEIMGKSRFSKEAIQCHEAVFSSSYASVDQKIKAALGLNELYRRDHTNSEDIKKGFAYLSEAYKLGFKAPEPVICFPMGGWRHNQSKDDNSSAE